MGLKYTDLRPYQFHQASDELRGRIDTKVETFVVDHFANVVPKSRAEFLWKCSKQSAFASLDRMPAMIAVP